MPDAAALLAHVLSGINFVTMAVSVVVRLGSRLCYRSGTTLLWRVESTFVGARVRLLEAARRACVPKSMFCYSQRYARVVGTRPCLCAQQRVL